MNCSYDRVFVLRDGLVSPSASSWSHLLKHGDSISFLKITGLTRQIFTTLGQRYCQQFTVSTNGRPQSLTPLDQLGLVLVYFNSLAAQHVLCLVFGITPAVCNRTLRKGIPVLFRYHYIHYIHYSPLPTTHPCNFGIATPFLPHAESSITWSAQRLRGHLYLNLRS